MITKLNLATNPFRNRILPYLLAFVLIAFSVAGSVLAFSTLGHLAARSEVVDNEIRVMNEELEGLNEKSEKLRQELSPTEQQLLVEAHKLVANKSFGWSKLFADLEAVLPGNVSASRISVQRVYKDGNRLTAELELGVLSRDYQSVMAMIDRMQNSGVFRAEIRGQDRRKGDAIVYSEYTLSLLYSQSFIQAPPVSDTVITEGNPDLLDTIRPMDGGGD